MERNRPIQEQEYQQALEAYARELNSKANVQEQNDKEADRYNSIISGITEPVGTALIHPVAKNLFENQVKPALRKALGRGARAVERTGRQAVADLRDGVNPLDNIASEARQTLSGVRGAVSEVGDNLQSALSDSGRALVNNARALAGRRPLMNINTNNDYATGGSQPIEDQRETLTSTRETDDAFPEPVSPTTFGGVSERPDLDTIEEDPTEDEPIKSIASDPEKWQDWVRDNAPEVDNQGENFVESMRGKLLQTDQISDDLPQSFVADQYKRTGQLLPSSEAPEAPQEPTTTTTAPQEPATAPQQPAPRTGTEADEVPASTAEAPEESLSSTLATEAGEAEVAGGGPEDIFGDIIAGVLGLGSVIAGAVDPVKPKQYTPTIANPSVQYGI